MITDPSFYWIAVLAVLVLGLSKSGFLSGFGSLVTPMLALTMPAPQAAALMLPLLFVMDVTGVQKLWRDADRAMLRQLLPGGLAGIAIGILVFGLLSTSAVSVVLGVITLLFLAQRRWGSSLAMSTPSPQRGRWFAAASGFTSFIAHAGGPPMLAYVLPLKLAPITVTATMAIFFGVINLAKWVPYAALGLFDWRLMTTSLVLLPLAPIGVWLGIWLTRRVSAKAFYVIADLGMLVTGLKLVSDGFR